MTKPSFWGTVVFVLLATLTGLYLWFVPSPTVRVHEQVFQLW